jgi:hypothetical protein
MMKNTPNYKKYPLEELMDAYSHIDKVQWPERVEIILHEINKRKNDIKSNPSLENRLGENENISVTNQNEYIVDNTIQNLRILIVCIASIILLFIFLLHHARTDILLIPSLLFILCFIFAYFHFFYAPLTITLEGQKIILKSRKKTDIIQINKIKSVKYEFLNPLYLTIEADKKNYKSGGQIKDISRLMNSLLKIKPDINIQKKLLKG